MSTFKRPQWPESVRRSQIPFAEQEIETSVPARFARVAQLCPQQAAVETETYRWTYAELDHLANGIARSLLAAAGETPEPVALLFAHDAPLIAAILAVLKAGKFFSVLPAEQPAAYLRFLLDDLQTRWLLTDREHLGLAGSIAPSDCRAVLIDDWNACPSGAAPEIRVGPDDCAAVLHTSGTTGQPKAVIRRHCASVQRALADHDLLGVGPADRATLFTMLNFGSTVNDLTDCLLNGATALPFDVKQHGAAVMVERLAQLKPTIFHPPVALLRQLLALLAPDQRFSTVRLVTTGGAVLYRQDVEALRPHVPPTCVIQHRFSSSEAGNASSYFMHSGAKLDDAIIPAGYAMPGRTILIEDEAGQFLPPDVVGEIMVRSRFLVTGYWRRPELTAAKFSPAGAAASSERTYHTGDLGRLREDGCLELLGRRDSLVKIRGYQVGLATVEAALLGIPQVKEAAAVAQPGPAGEMRIVAYVVWSGSGWTTADLRRSVAATLPEYMVPSAFVVVAALPLTGSGKVDRQALARMDPRRRPLDSPAAPPSDPLEDDIAGIWADVLGLDEVGIHDSFAELGGDSLLATQVLVRVQRQFTVQIPLQALFQPAPGRGAATVAQMAATVRAQRGLRDPERLQRLLEDIESLDEDDVARMEANEAGP